MVLRLGLDYDVHKSERHLLWCHKTCQMNDASQCQFYFHNIRHACYKSSSWTNIKGTGSITFTVYTGRMQSLQASILHLNLGISTVFSQKWSLGHIKSHSTACHQRIISPKPVVCSIPQDAGVHYSKPIYQLERLIATSSSSSSPSLSSSSSSSWKGKLLHWSWKHSPYSGTFLLFGKSVMFDAKEQKTHRQLSFAPFFVKLMPLAFSISASFSAFFFSNSACLQFSSCAFRYNLIKFSRVVVTAIVKRAPITS